MQVNIFSIDKNKEKLLEVALLEKGHKFYGQIVHKVKYENNNFSIQLSLYYKKICQDEPRWNWLLMKFPGVQDKTLTISYSIIILVKIENDLFAITYANGFFMMDKFCDRNFGFRVARKFEYTNVKRAAINSPGSKKRKTVSTFSDYKFLDFDPGEAFIKLKVSTKLPHFLEDKIRKTMEFGTSVKLQTTEDNLDVICHAIIFIRDKLNEDDITSLPLLLEIKDEELIKKLNDEVVDSFCNIGASTTVDISELDIIGVAEVFNSYTYELTCKRYSWKIDSLTRDEVIKFCNDKNIDIRSEFNNIKVKVLRDGTTVDRRSIFEWLEVSNDFEHSVLQKGKWYYFNDDFINAVDEEIDKLTAYDMSVYNYRSEWYEKYIEEKANEIIQSNRNKDKNQAIRIAKQKNYREYAYNDYLSKELNYKIGDRNLIDAGHYKFEVADLYNDTQYVSVKIGSNSSSLCYVVEQSLIALHYILANRKDFPNVTELAIWLVFDRKNHLSVNSEGFVNLCELNMILLKRRILEWAREVRIKGLRPVIFVSYTE